MGPEIPFIATEQSNRQQPQPPQIDPPVPQSAAPVNNSIPTPIAFESVTLPESACHRCSKCNAPFEEFSEEELGLCIVIISTFVHRELGMAGTMLPEILRCNAKCTSFLFFYKETLYLQDFDLIQSYLKQFSTNRWAESTTYTWQMGSNLYVPGEVGAIARQLAGNENHKYTFILVL